MFKWLERWFQDEPIGLAKIIKYVCLFTVINCAWIFGIFFLLDYLKVMPSQTEESGQMPFYFKDILYLLGTLFSYALIEEMIFRFFPISVMSIGDRLIRGFLITIFIYFVLVFAPIILLAKNFIIFSVGPLIIIAILLKDRLKIILTIVFLSSILFAFAHGPAWWHLLFQGIGGPIFSVRYLKCSGYNDLAIKPLLASASVHFLSNVILIIGFNILNL